MSDTHHTNVYLGLGIVISHIRTLLEALLFEKKKFTDPVNNFI